MRVIWGRRRWCFNLPTIRAFFASVFTKPGHSIRSHKKLDRLVTKQEWLIRQLKQNVCNTLFHRLLLATQVWQWNWKKRNFCQFLVVFDWSNQWAKNIWNGLSVALVYKHHICNLINSSLLKLWFFHFVSVIVFWKSFLGGWKSAENVPFPHPNPLPIIALTPSMYPLFQDNSALKLHVYGKL